MALVVGPSLALGAEPILGRLALGELDAPVEPVDLPSDALDLAHDLVEEVRTEPVARHPSNSSSRYAAESRSRQYDTS